MPKSQIIQPPPPSASGTVTAVSVVSAFGISGSVANPTTTPAITLKAGWMTAANEAARLALTGLPLGQQVKQTDNTFTYTLNVVGGESSAGNWAVAPKVYLASVLLGDPPVEQTVGQNNIGAIVLSRESTGSYNFTLSGAFADATFCTPVLPATNEPSTEVALIEMSRSDTATCILRTFDKAGVAVDSVAVIGVQILTYPA